MKGMNLEAVARAVGGRLVLPGDLSEPAASDILSSEASSVVIDSRKCSSGCIFIATVGSRVDGHSFIGGAFETGALGVVCEKEPSEWGCECEHPGPYILVKDSFAALRSIANYYRTCMMQVKIVGIVGSVGKTSTKELVASVLGERYSVLKTEGNFNNEVGVPLTILRIRDEHEVAVVEMGISNFGEMDRLGEIVRPDAVVMTNIGPCHLEFLGDLDGVLRAKSEVLKHIRPGGTLFVNASDERLSRLEAPEGIGRVSYGPGGDFFAENVVSRGLEGSTFTVADISKEETHSELSLEGADISCTAGRLQAGRRFEAETMLPGAHMVLNSLAASAVGVSFGMNCDEIAKGIGAARPVSGRSRLIRTDHGLFIDDCYNANPKSMKSAIDMLKDALGRRCAILGDMFELGEDELKLHAEIGEYAIEGGVKYLICIGERSRAMYESATARAEQLGISDKVSILRFSDLNEFLEKTDKKEFTGEDTILVKASNGMNFSRIIAEMAT